MTAREKLTAFAAGAQAVAALLIVFSPKVLFPVCESPMHCYESWMAELGMASAILVCAAGTFLARGAEAKRLLAAPSAVCGVFAMLFPSYLIGVCGSPMMACHYGLLPVWNLAGGAVILLSIVIFFAAREVEV